MKALRRRGKPVEEVDVEFEDEESEEVDDSGDSSENSNAEEEEGDSSASTSDSSDPSGSEAEDMEVSESPSLRVKRAGFKDWAQRQIQLAKDTNGDGSAPEPEYAPENLLERPAVPPPRTATDGLLHGPLGSSDAGVPQTSFAAAVLSRDGAPPTSSSGPAQASSSTSTSKFVQVTRTDDIQTSRLLLPVVAEEQAIIEAIRLNPVVVICGETGSGKTTQVPQFLYEAGFGSPGSGKLLLGFQTIRLVVHSNLFILAVL